MSVPSTAATHISKKTVLLIGHGGFYNRGCEAIVRSTVTLLRQAFGDVRVLLSTFDPAGDAAAGYALVDRLVPASAPRWTLPWALARLMDLRDHQQALRWWLAPLTRVLPSVDLVLSVGGDNYCYGTPHYFIELDRLVRRQGIPLVLWGASVDTTSADAATCRDLQSFDLITARETITVEHLARCGATANVRLVADPAFILPATPCDLTACWPQRDNILGFNISPLLARCHPARSAAQMITASVAALRYMIDQCGWGVVLVPHVLGRCARGEEWNTDAHILGTIYREIDRPGAIVLVPGIFNAEQTKYIISRCRLFVGARTHSTIAALSSQVPTLSIGYSLKAWGINRDIFGDTRCVLDATALDAEQLIGALQQLLDEEEARRQHLQKCIPTMIDRAYEGSRQLAALAGCG
ncbi:MAG: polysaccharide pyruvyl transferase family protein [Armatimonadota bacterium]